MSIRFHSSVLLTADIRRLSAFYIEVLGQAIRLRVVRSVESPSCE